MFNKSKQQQHLLDASITTGRNNSTLPSSASVVSINDSPTDYGTAMDSYNLGKAQTIQNNISQQVAASAPPLCRYTTAVVKAKVLADMVEALVGACYLSGGIVLALEVLRHLHVWPTAVTPTSDSDMVHTDNIVEGKTFPTSPSGLGKEDSCEQEEDRAVIEETVRVTVQSPLVTPVPEALTLSSSPAHSSVTATAIAAATQVSDIFHYSFHNPTLLVEALTCASACIAGEEGGDSNYQRLEFLGDAVLDLVGQVER